MAIGRTNTVAPAPPLYFPGIADWQQAAVDGAAIDGVVGAVELPVTDAGAFVFDAGVLVTEPADLGTLPLLSLGVPPGGSPGDVLTKVTTTDGDSTWAAPAPVSSGGSWFSGSGAPY